MDVTLDHPHQGEIPRLDGAGCIRMMWPMELSPSYALRLQGMPLWLCVGGLVLLCGCDAPGNNGDGDGDADADTDADIDADADSDADAGTGTDPFDPVEVECQGNRLGVLRANPWPGKGLQVHLELRTDQGLPEPEGDLEALSVTTGRGEELTTFETAPGSITDGYTAIIVVPTPDPILLGQRLDAVLGFLEALPERERIGLWRADGGLDMVAELTTRRHHLHAQASNIVAGDGDPPPAGAVEHLFEEIVEVGGPTDSPSRVVVVVGDPADEINLPASLATVARLDGQTSGLDAAVNRSGWAGGVSPSDAGAQLAEHLAQLRASIAVVGICAVPDSAEQLVISRGESSCTFSLPAWDERMDHVDCSPLAAATDDYPFGDTVDLILSDAEMEVWTRYDAEKSEADFTLRIALGDSAPIKAVGHYRGQTSLDCRRKSLSIDLDGPTPLPLAPRAAADEFYLISMCKDRAYFRQVLANGFLRRLDLFPLENRIVEVRLNGQSRGAYLLLEKPTHTLRRGHTDIDRVIRRRTGHDFSVEAEVKHPDASSDEQERELLTEFTMLSTLVDTTAPGDIYEVLSERFDFDNYLRWLAFETLLRNGDYVDETFFYASTELGGAGEGLYFRNMAWDNDDLDSRCHHSGRYALTDPWGIAYCAEDEIDLALLLSDEVYTIFVDHLDVLLGEVINGEALAGEAEEVRAELFAVLDHDAACAAMVELGDAVPEEPSCDDVQAEIDRQIQLFLDNMARRRDELTTRIEDWRGRP
jgi:hypothetical protein